MNKKQPSERDICTKFIAPALEQAGWDSTTQAREEFSFTKGRMSFAARIASCFSRTVNILVNQTMT